MRKLKNRIWERQCPRCGKRLVYKSKRWYYTNRKYKKLCQSCTRIVKGLLAPSRKGCHLTEEQKKRVGECAAWRHKIYGHPMLGKHHTPEAKLKISKKISGCNNGMYGKHHSFKARLKISKARIGTVRSEISQETRRKLRVKRIKEISDKKYDGGQVIPSYNSKSCDFFKKINDEFKWNGQYATNGGEYHIKELGYFVDYYEPKLNLVIEWDENFHYDVYGNLKEKDKIREDEIKSHLKCHFIRIKEKDMNDDKVIKNIYETITKSPNYADDSTN